MRLRIFVRLLSLFFVLSGSRVWANSNPVPFLSSALQPTAVADDSPGFTLTVNGSNFVSSSTVNWNGRPRATSFVSNTQLTAAILASDVESNGTAYVTVTNPGPGGGVSNNLSFEVRAPHTQIPFGETTSVNSGLLGPMPQFILPGEFKGDGKVDLVVGPSGSTFSVLLGKGDGTFAAPAFYGVPPRLTGQITTMLIGDFNGDGKPDIFVTYIDTLDAPLFPTHYTIFFGNGDGTFSTNNVGGLISSVAHTVAVDINRDGYLDIVGICTDSTKAQTVCVLRGDGAGHFATTTAYAPSFGTNFDGLAVGDFNRDGKLDLVLSGEAPDADAVLLTLLAGNGDGTFGPPTVIYSGGGVSGGRGAGLAVADLNSDGFLDLVFSEIDLICPDVTCATAQISSFVGNGDGTFQSPLTLPGLDPAAGSLEPLIADLDGDGNPDIVIQNQILALKPNGLSLPHRSYPAPFNVAAVGDLNGDGKVDLIGLGPDSSHLAEALQVRPKPDFVGSLDTPFQTIVPGGTARFNILITPVDNFTGTVRFKASGLPEGAVASFNPASVKGGGPSVLSIVTSSSTPTNSYHIELSGRSGDVSHAGTVTLNVGPQGTDFTDFAGSVSPSFVDVVPGSFGAFRIDVLPLNGFAADVDFTASGLPAGSTASFSPNPLTGGSGSAVLTISTVGSIVPGTYRLILAGTSGTHTHSTTVGLNIGQSGTAFGDFTGSVSPTFQSVRAGEVARYIGNVVSIYGFTGTVTVSVTNLPPHTTLVGSPSVSGGSGPVTILIQTTSATPPGTYNLHIVGSSSNVSGPLEHSTNVTLKVEAADDCHRRHKTRQSDGDECE